MRTTEPAICRDCGKPFEAGVFPIFTITLRQLECAECIAKKGQEIAAREKRSMKPTGWPLREGRRA
jgi:hypothetical protein